MRGAINMFSHYSKILVAYDDSELSKKALETALKLAELDEHTEISIVTVVQPFTPSYVENYVYYEEVLDQIREQTKEFMTRIEEDVLDKIPNKTDTIILEGHPGKMIIEYAKSYEADLIVIGSRGLSGLKEFMLGSVSSKVVQLSSCPVLIIK